MKYVWINTRTNQRVRWSFLINESKLDDSFPSNQSAMSGYELIRKDRKKFGRGIAFYIKNQVPILTKKIENPSYKTQK